MGLEIKAKNPKAKVVYRFIGREVFLKCNNMQYAAQLIKQIEDKGGSVQKGRQWLRCDIFGKHETAKMGENTIDLKTASDIDVEKICCDFFAMTLKKAQFSVEVCEI